MLRVIFFVLTITQVPNILAVEDPQTLVKNILAMEKEGAVIPGKFV